jgi:hypothetical protein
MHEVALADNSETREVLYKAFLRSELIAPGTASPSHAPGKFVSDGNMKVKLALTDVPPGKLVLPVFTNEKTFVHFYGSNLQ